jgi:putative transposase
LLQGEEREAAGLMQELLRRSVRLGLYEAMAAEVEALCGPKHRPDAESDYRRAGSERGIAFLDGEREEIVRPRVREKEGGEVRLATYEAASSPQALFERVVAAVAEGLPIRGAERATGRALSKSEASRMWVEKSREQLEELRTRPLEQRQWLAVLIDGVRLAEEVWVIVAVGIDLNGDKQVLDFEQGNSENATAVGELLERLARRGVREPANRRLLVLRDGSEAIHRAVQRHWPSAVQQECLVHAHSNVRDKVKRRDRADVDRHFKTLRQAQGREAGEEAFEDLLEFLSERNGAAAVALKARRDRLLAFHRLEVPATLNRTFLSTNLIENVLRNWREATGNVKRWSEKSDMVPRWMASGLLWAEAGFRRIPHAEDLSELLAALSSKPPVETAP